MSRKSRTPLSDTDLYRKLLIIFPIVQLVMGLALFVLTTTAQPVLYGLFVAGIICAVLSYRFWSSRTARVVCRIVVYVLLIGFPLAAGVALVRSAGADFSQSFDMFWVNTLAMVHTIQLFLTPAMAQAALHGRRMDVNFLRVMVVINELLAIALYVIPAVFERIEMGVDNWYFRLFCLACVSVTTVTSFLIPPALLKKAPRASRSEPTQRDPALPEETP